LSVQGVAGWEEVSRGFRYEVHVTAASVLSVASVIGARASLSVGTPSGRLRVRGVVIGLRAFDPPRAQSSVGFAYVLEIGPRLALLDLHRQNRILGPDRAVNIQDVIQGVLAGAAQAERSVSVAIAARYDLRGTYQSRHLVVQYDESDLAFLKRQCEAAGVFFYVEHGQDQETVVFGDDPLVFPDIEAGSGSSASVPFGVDPSRGIRSFGFRARALSRQVSLRSYNPQRPTQKPAAQADVQSGFHGVDYRFGGLVGGALAAADTARVRAQALACRGLVFRGVSNVATLRAGSIFALTQHPDVSLRKRYLVTRVEHVVMAPAQAGFRSPVEPRAYENVFECIPADVPFRPERSTPVPRVDGIHTARVDGPAWGGRAEINADGWYKVTFQHVATTPLRSQGSPYLRKMSPYAGPSDTGLELPLLPGTEVQIAYRDGDIDDPIILGAVPNADTASVVKQANQQYNRLRTPSGIVIEMFDGPPPTSTTP
jgi:type VI secretion system secreted protein VgrG